jgi:hypothetical protein
MPFGGFGAIKINHRVGFGSCGTKEDQTSSPFAMGQVTFHLIGMAADKA